jgi:hypothetical protein
MPWPPPPKIIGRYRSTPRTWGREMEALAQILTDQCWIVRRVRGTGTTRGAPNYVEETWGPYPGMLSQPSTIEERNADRYAIAVNATLSIASDVWPYVSDQIDVTAPDNASPATAEQNDAAINRFRVLSCTPEVSRFNAIPVFHLELAILEED